MGYEFNGTSSFLRMTIGALSAAVAGPMTIAVCADLDDTVDGALVHLITSGAASCAHVEVFGGNINYGTGATARNWATVSAADGPTVFAASKASGAAVPRGMKLILGGSPVHADATGGTVGDGSAPGATGFVQIGRYAGAAEYRAAKIYAVAVWLSVLSDADKATLTTWADWLALGPAFAVEFTEIGARSDATAGGSVESTRTDITLVADPPGFFGGAPDPGVPDGINVAVSPGSPSSGLVGTKPGGIEVSGALGSPASGLIAAPTPSGIAVPVSLGDPASPVTAVPAGINVSVSVGSPASGYLLSATPSGIAAQARLGSPTAGEIVPDDYVTALLTASATGPATLAAAATPAATLIASSL